MPLSLRLYLDDCAYSKMLVALPREPPHQHSVTIPEDAGLRGAPDMQHFVYARAHGLVVVTKNPSDFEDLHRQFSEHPGVFAVYQDNDARDMSHEEIAQAIANIVGAKIPIPDRFHILNQWRY